MTSSSSPRFSEDALAAWIEYEFDRSGGPGGQNVNKVSTRATLLFDFENGTLLSQTQKARIRQRLGRRLSADGRVRIVSQSERSQLGNREDALRRLIQLLETALHVDAPRVATRPTLGSKRRRLDAKRRAGALKQSRRATGDRDS